MSRRPQTERNAAIALLHADGLGPAEIAQALSLGRNVVAGVLHRHRHPRVRTCAPIGWRDPERVLMLVAEADRIGLMRAAERFAVHASQLCRWRQRVRAREAASQ